VVTMVRCRCRSNEGSVAFDHGSPYHSMLIVVDCSFEGESCHCRCHSIVWLIVASVHLQMVTMVPLPLTMETMVPLHAAQTSRFGPSSNTCCLTDFIVVVTSSAYRRADTLIVFNGKMSPSSSSRETSQEPSSRKPSAGKPSRQRACALPPSWFSPCERTTRHHKRTTRQPQDTTMARRGAATIAIAREEKNGERMGQTRRQGCSPQSSQQSSLSVQAMT
jgi:hypothetical protein